MRKILIIGVVSMGLLTMFSCKKTNHSVYMTVTGNCTLTQIKYGEGSTLDAAKNQNTILIGASTNPPTSLPWTSQTYTVNGGSEVFYLDACNEAGGTPTYTINIYDNGTNVSTNSCNTSACLCTTASEYAAN